MTTNWAFEKYWRKDYLGKQLDWENIKEPSNRIFQFDQDEFKEGSYYCTAYACFAAWSAYVWEKIKKEWRKEFIDICIEEWIIKEGVGGWLHEVVHRFKKFISKKTGKEYNYARISLENRDIHDKGFKIVTGAKLNQSFMEDIRKDGVLDDITWGTGDRGHALSEFDFQNAVNSYKDEPHNIFAVPEYKKYIGNTKHFNNGYFFYTLKDKNMSQREKDLRDIKYWYNRDLYNEEKVKKVKRWVYDTTVQCALMVARSNRDLSNQIEELQIKVS